ncbi:MAG: NAD-dependent dehydratase [Gammaproteobacteria bacterium]|nr:MAG: NAD-dependent dehydratase [Gammaproteobacteria bacterium]
MIKLPSGFEWALRHSLSFLWLFTAATSFWWARDIGLQILAQQNISGDLADICINSGSFLDALIGFWLLTGYRLKICYMLQLALITTYSILISFIAPQFWLHPFGPVTKNIPILALIVVLMRSEKSSLS